MDVERVDAVFAAALERAPEDRAAFLETACAGDEALRREVEALLACMEEAERALGDSITEFAGPLLAGLAAPADGDRDALAPEDRVG